MNRANLQTANAINDQIKSRESVIEYLKRYEKDNDPIRAVAELLTSCKNVGNERIKKELATAFIKRAIDLMREEIEAFEKQFSELK